MNVKESDRVITVISSDTKEPKTIEELMKIITIGDVECYFKQAVDDIPDLKNHLLDEAMINKIIFMLNAAYERLIMFRNTHDRHAMKAIFKDELLVTVGDCGTLFIEYPTVIIDSKNNIFTVKSKYEKVKEES